MSEITVFLELLSDGKWHKIEELGLTAELCEAQTHKVTSFLLEYDLAVIDAENKKVRINRFFQEFLIHE